MAFEVSGDAFLIMGECAWFHLTFEVSDSAFPKMGGVRMAPLCLYGW